MLKFEYINITKFLFVILIYSNFSNTRKVKVKPTILTKLVESCINVLSKTNNSERKNDSIKIAHDLT